MKLLKHIFFFFEFIFFILTVFYYKHYIFCINCIDKQSSAQCNQCSIGLVFKGLKILSDEETLDEIIYNNKSISRFGDGEFKIIFGISIRFQKTSPYLSERLYEILNNKDSNFLVGLNVPYKIIPKLSNRVQRYWLTYFDKFKFKIAKIISRHKLF